jgi:hypothetical protein
MGRKGRGGEENKEREGRKKKKRKKSRGRVKKVDQDRAKQIKISTEWKKEIRKKIYLFIV